MRECVCEIERRERDNMHTFLLGGGGGDRMRCWIEDKYSESLLHIQHPPAY